MTSDVSVVIPYFNAKNTIARALYSVKEQTLSVKEVIIVNDGSDFSVLVDETRQFESFFKLILIDLSANFGAAHARNIGIKNSSSRFIAFLDADDIWHPMKISIQYEFMCRTESFLTCHEYIFNLNLKSLVVRDLMSVRKLEVPNFIWKTHIFTPTVMVVKKNLVGFDDRLTRSEDLKCWISNFLNGKFYFIKLNLAGGYKNAVGESGLSSSYALMHEEYLNAWKYLLDEDTVGRITYTVAVVVEYVKYPVRLFISWLRKW